MQHTDLAGLAHSNMVEAFALLPRYQRNGRVRRDGGVLVAATGSPIPLFNEVVPIDDDVEAGALHDAVQAVRGIGCPWVMHLRSDAHEGLVPTVLGLGLEEVEVFYPAMTLSDLPRHTNVPPELDVVRFGESRDYDTYIRHAALISGADPTLWRGWLGAGLLDDPNVAVLVGYVDGEPVARSMGIRSGQVVGIYDVGTIETARRRGYGWAMTLAAMVAGSDAATAVATLQSSRMGYSVYSAHGFRTVFEYRQFRESGDL